MVPFWWFSCDLPRTNFKNYRTGHLDSLTHILMRHVLLVNIKSRLSENTICGKFYLAEISAFLSLYFLPGGGWSPSLLELPMIPRGCVGLNRSLLAINVYLSSLIINKVLTSPERLTMHKHQFVTFIVFFPYKFCWKRRFKLQLRSQLQYGKIAQVRHSCSMLQLLWNDTAGCSTENPFWCGHFVLEWPHFESVVEIMRKWVDLSKWIDSENDGIDPCWG